MKMINYAMPVVMALFTGFVSQAQTVDEIIDKHANALGGKDKLAQVKSVYTENTMEIMGNQAPVTEYLLEGKGFKSESEYNGAKIIQCYTDKGGWQVNAMAGMADPQPMADDMYKSGKGRIYAEGSLIDYAAKGNKAELAGNENGSFKINVTNGSNVSTYYVDTATYLLNKSVVKGEMMGQPVDITVTFSDYKKTDFGIVMPYTKTVDLGSFSFTSKMNKVEVNKEIDPKIFEMPK
jgi:hypothetical protein